jgi:hypothetical protein
MNKGKKKSRARIGYVKSNHLNLILFSSMTKTRLALDSFTLLELKSQIGVKLRFPINSKPDCKKLSEILLLEGFGSVSETTLYRLLVNYSGIVPYKNTLNILVNYIGYPTWENFREVIENVSPESLTIINKQAINENGLLYQCIALEADKPLQAYFESLSDKSHEYQFRAGLDVFDSLQQVKNPKRFFTTFIKNDFVKQYVLEYLFDPAFRIKDSDYAYSLYANTLKPSFTLLDLQDFVFSQSILFRYYYLQGALNKAIAVGKKIYGSNPIENNEIEALFIYPKIRLKAYKIWFFEMCGTDKTSIEDYVIELLDYARITYASLDALCKKAVFQSIAEVFCHSTVDIKFHLLLKEIFINEYALLPEKLFEKSIKNALPYFEANGLLHFRPLK